MSGDRATWSAGFEHSLQERRRRRREGLIILAAGSAVLLFALWEIRRPGANASASGNVVSFLLVNLNIILVLLLVFLVLRNLIKLFFDRRRRVPGSQLRARTVLAFVSVALFPAAVMLLVSLEFMTNAIDGWFGSTVESSLRGAWRLAQTHYVDAADSALLHARVLADELRRVQAGPLADRAQVDATIAEYRTRYRLAGITVIDADGALAARVNASGSPDESWPPMDADFLAEARESGSASRVDQFGNNDLVRAAVPILDASGTIRGTMVVQRLVEPSTRAWSEEILKAFREYRALALNKRPFKNLYALTMALASLVVLFSATWLGLYLARGITEPLGRLSDATRAVGEGNWDVRLDDEGGDEIGSLVRAFNAMTAEVKSSHQALEERRRYIESVLAHVDVGVVSIDESGLVTTINPAAVSLLGLREESCVARRASEVLPEAGYREILALVEEVGSASDGRVSRYCNLVREDEGRTLQVAATRLISASGAGTGAAIFVTDVSQVFAVQRMEAWKEVARRIAHEIKNPLTPIQLATQRMQRRLGGRLAPEDARLFDDCANTIVREVEELKRLVNEFAQFARKSVGAKRLHDLNQIVEETLPLFREGRPDVTFAFEGGGNLPTIMLNRDAVKRALVNLLDNAVASVVSVRAKSPPAVSGGPDIEVLTGVDPDLGRVRLEVADQGEGIPVEQRARVFEPYFSTKPEGTGLGLAIVASVVVDHHAYIRLHENHPRGSRFVIEFPIGTDRAEA